MGDKMDILLGYCTSAVTHNVDNHYSFVENTEEKFVVKWNWLIFALQKTATSLVRLR